MMQVETIVDLCGSADFRKRFGEDATEEAEVTPQRFLDTYESISAASLESGISGISGIPKLSIEEVTQVLPKPDCLSRQHRDSIPRACTNLVGVSHVLLDSPIRVLSRDFRKAMSWFRTCVMGLRQFYHSVGRYREERTHDST